MKFQLLLSYQEKEYSLTVERTKVSAQAEYYRISGKTTSIELINDRPKYYTKAGGIHRYTGFKWKQVRGKVSFNHQDFIEHICHAIERWLEDEMRDSVKVYWKSQIDPERSI